MSEQDISEIEKVRLALRAIPGRLFTEEEMRLFNKWAPLNTLEMLLDERESHVRRIGELESRLVKITDALKSLANESDGFLSKADAYDHGITNMLCLSARIDQARDAINVSGLGFAEPVRSAEEKERG